MADLDEAVRALPGNTVVLRTRGLVQAEAEKWDAALADFAKAIEADPKDVLAYQMEAAVLVKIKKFPEALAVLEKGHARRPEQHRPARGQGTDSRHAIELQGCRRRNDPGAGHRRFESADPGTSGSPLRTVGRKGQGPGRRREDPGDQARPAETCIRMRAVLLADLGKYDAAIEALQSLHKANPKDSLTMLQLGMVYTSMKKYDKAIEVFNAILDRSSRRRGGHARPGATPS